MAGIGLPARHQQTSVSDYGLTGYSCAEVCMQLLGAVQLDNAETAVAAALQLRKDGLIIVTDDAIAAGLAGASLLGRFQVSHPKQSPAEIAASHY